MYKNRKSSRESIQLDPILGPFQTSPIPLCKQETKAAIYEADWSAQGCPDISPFSSQFSVSQGPFPSANLVPSLLWLSFSVLLLLLFNTGAEASACPSPLAWGRGMWPLPGHWVARPRLSLRLAGKELGRLPHLAPRGWKALQTLAHHSLAEAHQSAILPSIFQMGKWRHNHTWCGCRLARSQEAFQAGSPDEVRGKGHLDFPKHSCIVWGKDRYGKELWSRLQYLKGTPGKNGRVLARMHYVLPSPHM